jgi:hypothetical protein
MAKVPIPHKAIRGGNPLKPKSHCPYISQIVLCQAGRLAGWGPILWPAIWGRSGARASLGSVWGQPRACLCPVWGLSGAPVCGHCGAPRTLLGQVWVLHRAHSVAIAHRCASATLETSLKGWWGLRWGQSIWGLWSVWGQPGGQPYMANLSEPSLGWGPTLRRAGPVSTDGDTYNYRRDHSWRWRWGCDGG